MSGDHRVGTDPSAAGPAAEVPAEEHDAALDAVFDLAGRACAAYGRPDLAAEVERVRARLDQPHLRVVIAGEFKKGKSSLANALIGATVCPVDDDVPTAVPTLLHHAAEATAAVIHRGGSGALVTSPIALDDVAGAVTDGARARPDGMANADGERPVAVQVGLPRRLLWLGLQIVDAPGLGGLSSAHAAATQAALSSADAVVVVTDASQELSAPELDVARTAAAATPAVAVVVTKTDVSPAWRRIVELDRGHLERVGLRPHLFPVATPVRDRAVATGDRDLNDESGYPPLLAWLVGLARSRRELARRRARRDLLRLVRLLEEPFEAERAVLDDPARGADVIAELERAETRAEQLASASARWQQALGDGITDLTTETDHGLRRRIRDLGQEADRELDRVDPAEVWDEFAPWMYRRAAEEVAAVVSGMQRRAGELTRHVLALFDDEDDQQAVDDLVDVVDVEAPLATLAAVDGADATDLTRPGVIETGLTAVRGLQGGVLMFGMVGNLVGLTIAGPAVIGLGVVMGARSLRKERERQLTVRRQQAKQAARRYLDEVAFHVGKDVRDALRTMQRALRDRLAERAAGIRRSGAEALAAARAAAERDRSEAAARREDLDAELRRLATLRERIDATLGAEPAP